MFCLFTDHIEKKEQSEENIYTGKVIDEPEACSLLEDTCDKQTVQSEPTPEEQLDSEKCDVVETPDGNAEFKGFENTEIFKMIKRSSVVLKPFNDDLVNGSPVECNSNNINNAEESSSEHGRTRRKAALKISSFKELDLHA